MKKFSCILFFSLFLGIFLVGCSGGSSTGSGEDVQTITFYSVGGGDNYYNDILIPMFEEETGGKYKVEYARGTPQEIISKIKAQGTNGNIDIVATGIDGMPLGVEEGVWEELFPEYEEELNYNNLTDSAKAYIEAYDNYGVAMNGESGGPIIVYNEDTVSDPPTTFEELTAWIEENPKKFSYAPLSVSGPARGFFFGIAQMMGEDFQSGADLTKTWEYLETIGEDIDFYPSKSSDVFNLLYDGTIDIAPHMPFWYAYDKAQGQVPDNIEAVRLEGTKQIIDAQFYVMVKDLPEERKEAALEFIEFAMSAEAQAQQYQVGRVPANKEATSDMILPDYQDSYQTYLDILMPEFQQDGDAYVPEDDWILFPNTDVLNGYYTEWEDRIQSQK
ncbi:extracellular solute-binding protein [Oceanobacillus massiliensis]|uniref:extracellular solute-binding protein n=1 Tax=Oceanobacillus massiliensis TaxID=1465765 RepID=UPI0002888B9B|nr:extracellular solute-binding protein [Oceanobacillus massiliensis]